jgi:hypothetical protein
MENTARIKIDLVNGVEGNSIYMNDTRVCGNKPWGGGKIIKTWTTSIDNIENALGFRFTEEQLNKLNELSKSE